MRHFALAVALVVICASPAAAQSIPTTLPELSVHRDAQGCWAGIGPDATSGTNVMAGVDAREVYWLRVSGKDWHFADGAAQAIRLRAQSAPGYPAPPAGKNEATAQAIGFVDSVGWHGIVFPLEDTLHHLGSWPALSLYDGNATTPFAAIANPQSRAWGTLRKCLAELAHDDRGSGKPAAVDAAPRQPLNRYLSDDDYPAAALRAEEQGRVRIRLTISAHGIPSDCVVTEASGSATLDTATCALFLRRMRFNPALDADGAPTQASFSTAMVWRIPGNTPPAPSPAQE